MNLKRNAGTNVLLRILRNLSKRLIYRAPLNEWILQIRCLKGDYFIIALQELQFNLNIQLEKGGKFSTGYIKDKGLCKVNVV